VSSVIALESEPGSISGVDGTGIAYAVFARSVSTNNPAQAPTQAGEIADNNGFKNRMAFSF
jgi:hypothetical protein